MVAVTYESWLLTRGPVIVTSQGKNGILEIWSFRGGVDRGSRTGRFDSIVRLLIRCVIYCQFPCMIICLGFAFGSTSTPSAAKPGTTGGLTFGVTPGTTGGLTLGATPATQTGGFNFVATPSGGFQFGKTTTTAASTPQTGGFAFGAANTSGISFGAPAAPSTQAPTGGLKLGSTGKFFFLENITICYVVSSGIGICFRFW